MAAIAVAVAVSLLLLLLPPRAVRSIGVNYGTLGDNLPPPPQVADFLRNRTTINRIKIFDANPDILRAFAGSGVGVTITAANGDIPSLADLPAARRWVAANVSPFHPRTRIDYILVGNEIMAAGDKTLIARLVPAMRTLHAALGLAGIRDIRVTTPHSLGILSASEPPSKGSFRRGYDRAVFGPMLRFLRDTNSSFMVNPYPYFAYSPAMGNYALFKRNSGVRDRFTGLTYRNMFDAMLDAVHSAMKAVGYGDVGIAVGETGWPTVAEPGQPGVSPEFAATFNGRLLRHLTSGKGTPLMPGRRFDAYIFALFDENLKPGPTAERNFGLFRPDFSPVYEIGIMRVGGQRRGPGEKKWCVAKPDAGEEALRANIKYACGEGAVDCSPIQRGGACFAPNDVRAHASFAMNAFYQSSGRHPFDCDFRGTGFVTTSDPSRGACKLVVA